MSLQGELCLCIEGPALLPTPQIQQFHWLTPWRPHKSPQPQTLSTAPWGEARILLPLCLINLPAPLSDHFCETSQWTTLWGKQGELRSPAPLGTSSEHICWHPTLNTTLNTSGHSEKAARWMDKANAKLTNGHLPIVVLRGNFPRESFLYNYENQSLLIKIKYSRCSVSGWGQAGTL